MRLTRSIRRGLNRKLRPNWTQENLLTVAFKNQVKRQLIDKIKKAKTIEEVEEIIGEFSIDSLQTQIDQMSKSTFNKSSKEFDLIMGAFLQNPKNAYLNLRAKNLLHNRSDFQKFLDAYKHNVSLIKDLPKDLFKKFKQAYLHGTAFRGTALAKELYTRLGKRAKVIIRTESSNITSTLTQARMQKIGLNAYIWSTSEDSRVRGSHALLDGVLFFWNDPPTIDNYQNHCGRFINCRCVPIPVASLDDIKFPVKVANALNIQTKYIKGKGRTKGHSESKVISGSIILYTKERFIKDFGDQFM